MNIDCPKEVRDLKEQGYISDFFAADRKNEAELFRKYLETGRDLVADVQTVALQHGIYVLHLDKKYNSAINGKRA